MSNKRYWIWLQQCLGAGARFKEILEYFGSVEKLYNTNIIELRMSPVLTSKQIDRISKYNINEADRIIAECRDNNWQIIAYDDREYPQRLREIANPPAVLYVDGVLPNIDDYAVISIVGTRKASTYAIRCAGVMAKGVALCGALVVSGGAIGVDSAAHKGALSAGAKTVAVLGNGFGNDYLKSNQSLRDEIKSNGALITEYPPGTPATKQTFPMRNRIISGLCVGLLVVEAGVKSGSLITAGYAAEQGKDIYAVPASIFDYNFYGTNKLIDDGAIVATSPSVLVEGYAQQFKSLDLSKLKTARELFDEGVDKSANSPKTQQLEFESIAKDRAMAVKRQELAMELKGDEQLVYNALNQSFTGIDDVINKSSLNSNQVLVALTMLEMKGLVVSTSGKRYKLK
ncbi:MAG: DNA-processing protein DprA [Eubacterium sp.]